MKDKKLKKPRLISAAMIAAVLVMVMVGGFYVNIAYAAIKSTDRQEERHAVLVDQCKAVLDSAAQYAETTAQEILQQQEAQEKEAEETEELLRILTAECGKSRELSLGVVQALHNACVKYKWKYTPLEMAHRYGYTKPASWVSDAVRQAYEAIFEEDYTYWAVGSATMFYNPTVYGENYDHEVQIFVTQIGDVRFFEERRVIPEEIALQYAYLKQYDNSAAYGYYVEGWF